MSKTRMFVRNILITTVISAMLLTSVSAMAFAADESVNEPEVTTETVLPEGFVSSVTAVNVDGEAIESQIVYYLNSENAITTEDGTVVDSQISFDGILMDSEGNMISSLFDEEGNVTDENGEVVETVKAYLTDADGNMINNNIYMVTEDGVIIGAICGFFMDDEYNIVDDAGNIVIPAPAEEETESIDTSELEEITVPEDDDFIVIEELDSEEAPVAKATAKGWKTASGHKMYYYDSTNYYKNTRATIDGKEYAFDSKGYLYVNQFFTMDDKKYAATATGELASGSFQMGSYRYWANTKTRVVRQKEGLFTSGSKKYYSKANGRLVCNAFKTIEDHTYYFGEKGAMVKKGVFKAHDGELYFAIPENSHIKVQADFVDYNDKTYYVTEGGKIKSGCKFKVDGKTYIARKDGHLAKGIFLWNGSFYYANSKHVIKTAEGLIRFKSGNKYYVGEDGKLLTKKFKTIDGKKYRFGKNARALVGTFRIGNVRYTTDEEGAIVKKEYLDMKGIDVSYAQKTIDWKKVKADGIDFAIIRLGYSGASSGKSMEDDWFRDNIKGAKAAGLKVGVYYFTTAMTEAQGKREANFTTNIVESTGYKLDLPVVIDSESLPGSLAASKRGSNYNALSKDKRTAAVKAFCEQTVKNGYTPMIYASTSWLNSKLNMNSLKDYKVWVAQYNTKVTYGGTYQCWQYTSSGKVNGIKGSVDMNIWYGYDK